MQQEASKESAHRFAGLPAIRFPTPSLKTLRVIAFVGPVAFALTLGLMTDVVLEQLFPRLVAHIAASAIVAIGALAFTLWVFGVLATVHERLERSARLEERQHIAMKLHDDVIQSTYAALLRLETIRDHVGSEEACAGLDEGIESLNNVVASVRHHILEDLDGMSSSD